MFKPCLCHLIDNTYKAACKNSQNLQTVVNELQDIGKACRENPKIVNGICPNIQNQRWIIDFGICSFILKHANQWEYQMTELKRIMSILKSLTLIFLDQKTFHFKAFRIFENAIGALEEFEGMISYSAVTKEQIINYYKKLPEPGILITLCLGKNVLSSKI